jgi:hypothetical protein
LISFPAQPQKLLHIEGRSLTHDSHSDPCPSRLPRKSLDLRLIVNQ